jgi:hypothetical protein
LVLPVAPTAAPKLNAPPVITKEARGSLARDLRDDLPRSCAASFFVSCPVVVASMASRVLLSHS